MLKVGITGGIGSGKTTVARVFALLGVPVYNADEAARHLMNTHLPLRSALLAAFGPSTYTREGLNRAYLAATVFGHPEKLALLNHLVHPAVMKDAVDWMNRQTTPYILKEAALIFESGSQADLDLVIGVFAPLPLRILRTMHRDGLDRKAVMARLSQQLDESIKMKLCDFVIQNNDRDLVIPQVLALHRQLLQSAQSPDVQ